MGDNQDAAKIYKGMLSKMAFDKKYKFWIPIVLTIIGIIITTLSLWLQYKTESNKKETKPLQDTVRTFVPSNSPKSELIKPIDKKKK